MELKLKGKRALVMGASTGIGRAIAESLIEEGVHVSICSRQLDRLKQTAEQIQCPHYFSADFSKVGEGQRAVETAIRHWGGLDILVTNTGGPKKNSFLDVSREQWLEDFQSLWLSVTEGLQAALPVMKSQQYGRILMVTSLAAKEPLAGLTTSNGLRAGLAGLAKSIANEYAPSGVTLNLLLPGYTNTDRLKELNLSDDRVKQMVPAGRLGDPRELADLCTFLASPRAAYITGQSIAVDGGALKSF